MNLGRAIKLFLPHFRYKSFKTNLPNVFWMASKKVKNVKASSYNLQKMRLLAKAYEKQGNAEKALVTYGKCLQTIMNGQKQNGNIQGIVEILISIAQIHKQQKNYLKVLESYEEARNLFNQSPDKAAKITEKIYKFIGSLIKKVQQTVNKIEQFYEKKLAEVERTQKSNSYRIKHYAQLLYQLYYIKRNQEKLSAIRDKLDNYKTNDQRKKIMDNFYYRINQKNLKAKDHFDKSEFNEALKIYISCLKDIQSLKKITQNQARLLNNIALNYQNLENYLEAKKYYKQALIISEKIKQINFQVYFRSLSRLTCIAFEQKQQKQESHYSKQTKSAIEEQFGGLKNQWGFKYMLLASQMHYRKKQFHRAILKALQALAISEIIQTQQKDKTKFNTIIQNSLLNTSIMERISLDWLKTQLPYKQRFFNSSNRFHNQRIQGKLSLQKIIFQNQFLTLSITGAQLQRLQLDKVKLRQAFPSNQNQQIVNLLKQSYDKLKQKQKQDKIFFEAYLGEMIDTARYLAQTIIRLQLPQQTIEFFDDFFRWAQSYPSLDFAQYQQMKQLSQKIHLYQYMSWQDLKENMAKDTKTQNNKKSKAHPKNYSVINLYIEVQKALHANQMLQAIDLFSQAKNSTAKTKQQLTQEEKERIQTIKTSFSKAFQSFSDEVNQVIDRLRQNNYLAQDSDLSQFESLMSQGFTNIIELNVETGENQIKQGLKFVDSIMRKLDNVFLDDEEINAFRQILSSYLKLVAFYRIRNIANYDMEFLKETLKIIAKRMKRN